MSYNVIYADPPWFYNNRRMSGKRTRFGGGAGAHYALMRDEEILGMADFVKRLAAENCALFLWSTCPRLDLAMRVLTEWGFRYVTTAFHWIKLGKASRVPIHGPGYYTGSCAEMVLLGIKGRMKPVMKLIPSLVEYPRMNHSVKPEVVRKRIERMYGDVPRIELFARCATPGWDVWGDESDNKDEQQVLARLICRSREA